MVNSKLFENKLSSDLVWMKELPGQTTNLSGDRQYNVYRTRHKYLKSTNEKQVVLSRSKNDGWEFWTKVISDSQLKKWYKGICSVMFEFRIELSLD